MSSKLPEEYVRDWQKSDYHTRAMSLYAEGAVYFFALGPLSFWNILHLQIWQYLFFGLLTLGLCSVRFYESHLILKKFHERWFSERNFSAQDTPKAPFFLFVNSIHINEKVFNDKNRTGDINVFEK